MIIDFLVKNLSVVLFDIINNVSLVIKGVKIDPPKHVIKSFLGWRFCTGASTPKVFP